MVDLTPARKLVCAGLRTCAGTVRTLLLGPSTNNQSLMILGMLNTIKTSQNGAKIAKKQANMPQNGGT